MEFDKETLIAALIVSAGGTIEVPIKNIQSVAGRMVVLDFNPMTDVYTFTVEDA